MAVYPRPEYRSFLDPDEIIRRAMDAQRAYNERMSAGARVRRDGVIDLVEINGVWQVPR